MASTPFSTLMATTFNYRMPEVVDQFFNGHPLGAFLTLRKAVQPWNEGGFEIETNVSTSANSTVAARDYKSEIPLAEQDPLRTVGIGCKFVNGSVIWYKHQEDANSSSKTRATDFVNDLIDNATQTMQDTLSLQYWEDGTGETFDGLAAILSATNTYMGVNRSTSGNEYWKAKVGSAFTFNGVTYGPYNTVEPLVIRGGTDGGISRLYNDTAMNGGTGGADFGITELDLYEKLEALIGAKNVIQNPKMVDAGFPENIQWRGATIVWDNNAPAGQFAFLNSQFVKLRPYKGYDNKIFLTDTVDLYALGRIGYTRLMQWGGNLTCSRPGRVGALTAKTV